MSRNPQHWPAQDRCGAPVNNKIFVGGLSQGTTTESLNRHFAQFGQADAIVMMDKMTGRSRGFGFCTFTSPESAQKALAEQQQVDGKLVECTPCWAKSVRNVRIEADRKVENKVFVGALSQSTTSESLGRHFAQYGPCDAVVMMDKATGRSRGFGFCTFHADDSLVKALSTQQTVDGKLVDCKVCSPKGEVQMPYKPNRLFIGGLPQSADENKLRDFFSGFGPVTDARIMTDKESGRSRGFGYVTFQSPQSCELALANHTSNIIDDKWVEVKRCTEKSVMAAKGAPQALAHLSPQQLAQVAQLTAQLQNILGQPLVQSLQTKAPTNGSKGGGKGSHKGGNAYPELMR